MNRDKNTIIEISIRNYSEHIQNIRYYIINFNNNNLLFFFFSFSMDQRVLRYCYLNDTFNLDYITERWTLIIFPNNIVIPPLLFPFVSRATNAAREKGWKRKLEQRIATDQCVFSKRIFFGSLFCARDAAGDK